jgi:tetratricopeptide (TPR) repeat protein
MKINKKTIFELLGLVIVSLILYLPAVQFDFVNYDDQVYVLNNSFVLNPTFANLMDGSGTGNFHPITMITLWLDYTLGDQTAFLFHFSSILWHTLNTILVFLFVRKLLPKVNGAAFFVALLFAVHPMHIESVAWVSSRKDVLYTFFYLVSLITYFDYLKAGSKKFLLIAIVSGLISMLAKPSAITLPIALILLQYYELNKLEVKRIIPLIPMFLGSVIVGILTFNLQQADAINSLEAYSVFERVSFAFYGLFFYITKSILPTGLAPMHPYPNSTELLEGSFILQMVLGLVLVLGSLMIAKKNRLFGFGILFFFLNMLLMLQFVSIGRAIVSERYSYLSYVGLFIGFVGLLNLIPSVAKAKNAYFILSIIVGLPLLISASGQLKHWENSEKLWTKAIKENPEDWFGYIGRGNYYTDTGKNNKGLNDFMQAVELAPERFKNYFNLGDLQRKIGDVNAAIQTYSRAIEINPNYEEAYINRGQFYIDANYGANALADFNTAIELNPESYVAFTNRGSLYLLAGKNNEAMLDFDKAIEFNPNYSQAWFNRGTAYLSLDLNKAMSDLEQAVKIDPEYLDAYNNLGSGYYKLQEYDNAISAYTEALNLKGNSGTLWLNLSVVKNSKGDYVGAYNDAIKARNLGMEVSESYLNQLKGLVNR